MIFISWNIDSLNAALTSDSSRAQETREVLQTIKKKNADVIAIQETKLRPTGPTPKQLEKLAEIFPDYKYVWRSSQEPAKKSYSGTMFLYKNEYNPEVLYPKIDAPETMDDEGRIITLDFGKFYVTQVYTPNSGSKLARLEAREAWDKKYCEYLKKLDAEKPVIASGDYNVAHGMVDLKHPEKNQNSAGFTPTERRDFENLIDAGFTDTYRFKHPEGREYTWWDQRIRTSKLYNLGWRIDYFLVSNRIKDLIQKAEVLDSGTRKDHAPILLELNLTV